MTLLLASDGVCPSVERTVGRRTETGGVSELRENDNYANASHVAKPNTKLHDATTLLHPHVGKGESPRGRVPMILHAVVI